MSKAMNQFKNLEKEHKFKSASFKTKLERLETTEELYVLYKEQWDVLGQVLREEVKPEDVEARMKFLKAEIAKKEGNLK